MSQTSSLKHSIYEYNPQNRMVRSRVIDDEARTVASTRYGYDPLGRRALVQDNGATTLRTLYDGLGFDVVKESPVYANGGFTDTYNIGIQYEPAGRATGDRYRYLDDGDTATSEKYQYIEDNAYQTVSSRYAGERIMLYAHGSPVAVNRSSGTRGYLGTDILGSTRSVTDNHGVQESYYDYDIFGSPITGDYTIGTDYGYLGKPYDKITGLYNYGYRDYSPQSVRFTTVDPIRDGSNWFAYVNNDPVNYVDLWGLEPGEIFSTIEEAAIDFGITYNDDSIKNDREYGASVYKVTGGYTYTIPSRGTSDSVIMSVSPSDPSIAFLHTHAAYNPEYDNENFSSTDKKTAIKKGIDIYVATPGGTLKVFNPEANTTTLVSTDMPTENTPYNESKSIGFLQTIWNHAVNFFTGNSRLKEEVKNESKKNK